MLTLYHAPRSRSGRIVWLLEELGADYEIRYTDIVYGDGAGKRDPGNVHPDGKVPALMHDDVLITESDAIALYLTDLHPEAGLGAPVGDAERGAYLTWLCWTAGEMGPAYFAKMYGGAGSDPRTQAAFAAVIARISGALGKGPFLMGARFTAVDVMVGSMLAWAREYTPPSKPIDAYVTRITERPAHQRAISKDAPPI